MLVSAKKEKISINLLPEDPFFQTVTGKTLRWALSVGRYLVIFTELIVIISFATRFTLDRKITDLNKIILRQVSTIESYGDLEKKFVLAQGKIAQYAELTKQQNLTETFALLSAVTPPDVSIEKLAITKERVTISGQAISKVAFNQFINNLQLSTYFSNVTVSKVAAGEKGADYSFQLQTTTNQPPANSNEKNTKTKNES